MQSDHLIHRNILENMSDGVMTIDLQGQIIHFNPAGADILGLQREEVLGKKYSEIFFEFEGNDDFNQAILDAIYESAISHNRLVSFYNGTKKLTLALTTSFLQISEGNELKKIAVIVVFTDISEMQKLRDSEIQLTEDLKEKHKELQRAYLQTESVNKNLESVLKKVQVIRIVATVFTILLFTALGLFLWNKQGTWGGKSSRGTKPTLKEAGASQVFRVQPRPISHSISLTGTIDPLHVVNIPSPFAGRIKEVHFYYGEIVKAGKLLVALDTAELETKHREAKAAFIKARQRLKEVETWETSTEMVRARRSLTKAQLSLEAQKKTFEETERLFKRGIVPASEYNSAKQQYTNTDLDYQSAQDEVKTTLAKGNEEQKEIASHEMENARVKLKELEDQLRQSRIYAPVSGIVILPSASSDDKNMKRVEKGVPFQAGDILFSIGDLTGFLVKSKVDEVDMTKIKEGQKVRVVGDAFSNLPMEGKISSISSQASKRRDDQGSGIPSFEISVSIPELSLEQRKKIMVGMSANMVIRIYENPEALMVPLPAVSLEGERRFLTRQVPGSGPKGHAERIEVKTGFTTLDSVEIISGIKSGDGILLPGR